MKSWYALLMTVLVAGPLAAQDLPRSCDMEFTNTPTTRVTLVKLPNGNYNTYSGGGIVAHCVGQGNTLRADSAEYYENEGRLYLVGNVHYTEPRATVDSRTMTYYQTTDHLHAEGNVVAVMSNGSTLRGPVADYYRSTPQRPLARLVAPQRPRVTLVQRDTTGRGRPPDTAHVVANTIIMEGDSLVYASLQVEITRPDLFAKGDSAFLDGGKDFARLMGDPLVEGKRDRPFRLTGGVIDLYSRDRQLERVIATPNGRALSEDLELLADSIDLRVQANQLQRAMAWGNKRARAISPERNIVADSIDAIMPGQRVREVRAIGNAFADSKPDSGVISTERDWLSGDSIVARFDSVPAGDSARAQRIRQIVAEGGAKSYYQMRNSRGPETQPTVNYVRGRLIDIQFEDRRVATVTVTDQATGILIEPALVPAAPSGGERGPPTPASGRSTPARVPGTRR